MNYWQELKLIRNGNELSLVELANLELEKLQSMLEEIAGDLEDSDSMRDSLSKQSKRVKGEEETISKRIIRNLEKTNSFQDLGLSLAETHKETLRNKTIINCYIRIIGKYTTTTSRGIISNNF